MKEQKYDISANSGNNPDIFCHFHALYACLQIPASIRETVPAGRWQSCRDISRRMKIHIFCVSLGSDSKKERTDHICTILVTATDFSSEQYRQDRRRYPAGKYFHTYI